VIVELTFDLMKKIALYTCLLFAMACNSQKDADLIIVGKNVYTVDNTFSTTVAIAIKDGKIIETGSKEQVLKQYKSKEIIDAGDKFVYPGFIDAHCHFSGYGLDLYKCDLTGTKSWSEIIEKLVAYEKTNSLSWIYGRGWDQNDWDIKAFPSKEILDSLLPDKPVILKRIDGHAVLCNQKALDMARITAATKMDGGIVELKNGRPTGILIDNATETVENLIPILPEDQATKYLQQAENECYSLGLTGIVDCGVKADIIGLLQKLYGTNKLTIGNTVQLASYKSTLDKYVKAGPLKAGQLQINGIKVYGDGALGSRGACLLSDYHDMHGHRGMLLTSINDMMEIAKNAKDYKWQLCTHAIGDSANRTILKLYKEFLLGTNDLRWRIEHAQVVNKSDLKYFRENSIVPSVQPTHATSDMPWAETRLGPERINDAYSYKELLSQNGWIALGTDFPVEGINPIATFYAAVARKDKNGNPTAGFQPQNRLSRQEALKGMTIWAAKSVFNEQTKGSIEKGKDADIVILDKDIMNVPEKELLSTKVKYTIVKGIIKYKN
jgi:predicted amidohydrolase YtcJ